MSKRKDLPLETLSCESARRLHTRHRQYIYNNRDGQPDRAEDTDPAATICSPNATGRTVAEMMTKTTVTPQKRR